MPEAPGTRPSPARHSQGWHTLFVSIQAVMSSNAAGMPVKMGNTTVAQTMHHMSHSLSHTICLYSTCKLHNITSPCNHHSLAWPGQSPDLKVAQEQLLAMVLRKHLLQRMQLVAVIPEAYSSQLAGGVFRIDRHVSPCFGCNNTQ